MLQDRILFIAKISCFQTSSSLSERKQKILCYRYHNKSLHFYQLLLLDTDLDTHKHVRARRSQYGLFSNLALLECYFTFTVHRFISDFFVVIPNNHYVFILTFRLYHLLDSNFLLQFSRQFSIQLET